MIYKIKCKDCGKVYTGQTSTALRSRAREHLEESDFHGRCGEVFISPSSIAYKIFTSLTLTASGSLTAVPNGQRDYFYRRGPQFANRMPLMNTLTFLTFTRPLAVPSDVSAALLKHSFAFVAIYVEEGYSILTVTSTKKFFSQ